MQHYDGVREYANRTNAVWDGRRLDRRERGPALPVFLVIALLITVVGGIVAQVQAEQAEPAVTYVGR